VAAKLFHVDGQTNDSIMDFMENVTIGLNRISQTGNKVNIYTQYPEEESSFS
jgi:hypothetical protein